MRLVMPKGDGTVKAFDKSLEIYYNYIYNELNEFWLSNDYFKLSIAHELNLYEDTDGSMLIKKSELVHFYVLFLLFN